MTVTSEIRSLVRLAVPMVLTQVGMMMLGVVDTLMVGRVGMQALGAASLGHIWVLGTLIFAMGVIFGIDPFITQAHGAQDRRMLGLTLQRGLVLAAVLSIPIALLWLFTRPALELFGQEAHLASMAQTYARVQIPSIPFFLLFTTLRQYLQGRGIVLPVMFLAVFSNAVNALLNWVLIFGPGDLPAFGLEGAGMATGLTRIFMAVVLVTLLLRLRLYRAGWVSWSREAWSIAGLRAILHHGLPVGLQISLEVWAFQIALLMSGRLGEAALAAHTIVLNLASLTFMVPLGISFGAVTRVGNLIGARKIEAAQRAAWVALGFGAGVMVGSAVLFLTLRNVLPQLYRPTPEVAALAAAALPIAAAFQLFDGTQVVGGGVLRGMGRTRPAAWINLLGYYVLALPLAWILGFRLQMGLNGIWWGQALGLAAVAILLVLWIRHRGPARDPEILQRVPLEPA